MIQLDFSNTNIDKTIPVISISTVLDSLEHPFDREGVATKTYEKHFNNPDSEYYHKTVEEIINIWESKGSESRRYGSLLDDYIGTVLTGNDNDLLLYKLNNAYDYDERLKGLCNSFDDFYNLVMQSGDMEFVDREKTVYLKYNAVHPKTGDEIVFYIKGRFDALFYNKRTKKWIIIDWKSSGSIDKVPTRYTQKFLGPMFRWYALNYYRYTNQLHFYKKALIENYLPEGTNIDDVVVMIVNLPGKQIEENGKTYMTHLAGMPYDPILLDSIFQFAISKQLLENPNQTNEIKNEIISEQSDNIDGLF